MSDDPEPRRGLAALRTASVGWPAFIALLAVLTGIVALGASVGSWGGVALIVVTMVAMISLLTVWCSADPRGRAAEPH